MRDMKVVGGHPRAILIGIEKTDDGHVRQALKHRQVRPLDNAPCADEAEAERGTLVIHLNMILAESSDHEYHE